MLHSCTGCFLKKKHAKQKGSKKMKKHITRNTKTQVVGALRKIWRTHPLRLAAITAACVDNSEKTHLRKYRCAACKNLFYKQQIEVNHIKSASANEKIDEFIKRIFCNIKSYKGDDALTNDNITTTIKALAEKNLQVVCKECHGKITKEQNKKRRKK